MGIFNDLTYELFYENFAGNLDIFPDGSADDPADACTGKTWISTGTFYKIIFIKMKI